MYQNMKRTCTCKAYQVPVFAHETIISSKTPPLVNYNLVSTCDSLLAIREWKYVANDKSTFMSPATTRLNAAWFKPITIENRWTDRENITIVFFLFFFTKKDVLENDCSNK